MKEISYLRVDSVSGALEATRQNPGAIYLAGGTTVVELLREGVLAPEVVVDIKSLPLREIHVDEQRTRIGAMVSNADLAWHASIQMKFPAVAESLLASGDPQIRNMATAGGNLLQRTRCSYFRDPKAACNKRAPGSGCAALKGSNRNHAILGGSARCVAAHASDFAVALTAFDAVIHTFGPTGERAIPITQFFLEPGDTPERETVLHPGELIIAIDLPHSAPGRRSLYLKISDHESSEFALASAAVAADFVEGAMSHVRIALGGVGTVPWRCRSAEKLLEGRAASEALFVSAAEAALAEATTLRDNTFKLPLAKRTLVTALQRLERLPPVKAE